MPIFDLQCPNPECHERIELFIRSNENPSVTCQKCHKHELVKLPGIGGYSIKGANGASRTPKGAGAFRGKKQS
jgi:putative FmdB family regulatory protein